VRVQVVGGGLFGCLAAVELAKTGAEVHVFEAGPDILTGATARCQGRLHRGYHYPRSDATAAAAKGSATEFAARFGPAMRRAPHHFYAIAPGGYTTADEYAQFLLRHRLRVGGVADVPNLHSVDLVVDADESFVDVAKLRRLLRREITAAGVKVLTGVPVDEPHAGYDLVVFATYGQPWPTPLRYEVCELAIMELGRYSGDSYVVMDGEFVSLDPWPDGRYALYDVKHTVHHVSVGTAPEVPDEYADLIRRTGVIRTPLSRFDAMAESASRFLRHVEPHGRGVSIHHGSMFSVRAVLPGVDATDERPTVVRRDGNVIRILPGKIGTAIAAARQVVDLSGLCRNGSDLFRTALVDV
jgi:hypothetical protein